MNINSNHPRSILDQLPAAINRRLTDISCNEETFNKAKQRYEEALKSNRFNEKLSYDNTPNRNPRNRRRKIIWYNPPYNKSVKTNIGKSFLLLIQKHFPRSHKLHCIFNKNNVKVSHSCKKKWKAS